MFRIAFHIVVGAILAFYSFPVLSAVAHQVTPHLARHHVEAVQPLLAQNISVHNYHRGLRELNKELATIKEELRQERKARQRLEYEVSQSPQQKAKGNSHSAEIEKLSQDRDVLFDKVASLESSTRGIADRFTSFRAFGNLGISVLRPGAGGSRSQSHLSPLFFGMGHRFNDTVTLEVLLRKGAFAGEFLGGSGVVVQNAYLNFETASDWSVWTGRFNLPLSHSSHELEPQHYRTVAPGLFHQVLAPLGLTGDGVVMHYRPKLGLQGTLAIHSGLEADLIDGRSGLLGTATANERSFEKLGATARLDFVTDTTLTGGISAIYSGLARSVSSFASSNSPAGALLTGVVVDASVKIIGLELAAGWSHYDIDDSKQVNDLYKRSIGSSMTGFYVEGAFDILAQGFETSDTLMAFVRHDNANTQSKTSGFAKDPENLRKQTSFGLNYSPAKGVVFKADHVIPNDNSRATKDGSITRLGVGFSF